MSKAKKRLLIVIPIVTAAIAALFCLWWFLLRDDGGDTPVSVEKVSVITGMGGGLRNRFSGVVEPQATLDVSLDSSRTLDKTFVEEGDEVEEGDALFSYDTEALKLQIEQMELDMDRVESSIDTMEAQISSLKKERDKLTSDSMKLEYTQQIQSYEAQVKQEEYNLKTKELELRALEDKVDNSIVYAEMSGIIQTINDPVSTPPNDYYYYDPGSSSSSAYITILALGDFRVMGHINEQNIRDLEIGGEVLIRSRLDSEATWKGLVDYVDIENPVSGNDGGYYGVADDTMTTSTKYPFYISIEDTEGLMLGQHVYIEPDIAVEEDGLWLMEYYILTDEDGTAWVWAANQEKDKIEKRIVTLGGYDTDTNRFEIVDGLTPDDEIAWPADFIRAGMPVTREGFVDYGYGTGGVGDGITGPEESAGVADDTGDPFFDDMDIIDGGEDDPEAEPPSLYGEDGAPPPTSYVSGSDVPRQTAPASGSNVEG